MNECTFLSLLGPLRGNLTHLLWAPHFYLTDVGTTVGMGIVIVMVVKGPVCGHRLGDHCCCSKRTLNAS